MAPQKLTRQSARRLSAIMFTDMVGYSALTQKNEPLALELLEEQREILRPEFARHQGKEIETIGDAFFVEFNSALEAVQCAIAIQKKLHERNNKTGFERWIQIRIGVHVGDVIHRDRQVLGDCVNIAARMEPLAEPGGICLSEDVARQISNKIDLPVKSLGKEELKNIRTPINIFKVVLPWQDPVSSSTVAKKKAIRFNRRVLIATTLSLLVPMLIYLSYLIFSKLNIVDDNSTETLHVDRIAVLPFDNFSPNPGDAYIADGLTEEIITVLAKIENLHVIARTSVMKYKDKSKNVAEIAGELDVGTLLEGSIRKDENRIRVTAQLIDAGSQEHLWAESYDKELKHIFDLQDDIAYKIARALQIKLMDIEKSEIKKRSTKNVEAYNAYLKGRYYWNMRTPDNLIKGMKNFQYATELDSNFALAYAGIADSYHLLCSYGVLPPKVGFPLAKNAVMKALNLDQNLAEAHSSLAAINLLYDWSWEACAAEFEKTLKLNSNYIQAYSWYAMYFQIHKNFDRAHELVQRAIDLDPLSAIARTDLGQINYHAGNFTQAIEEYRKSLQLDSSYVYTYAYLGQAYALSNQLTAAEGAFRKAVDLTGGQDPAMLSGLGCVYAMQGNKKKARSVLDQLLSLQSKMYIHPMYTAIIYAALGETETAFEWLEKGFDERSEWMIYLQVEHMLQPLRDTEKFSRLIQRMKFMN